MFKLKNIFSKTLLSASAGLFIIGLAIYAKRSSENSLKISSSAFKYGEFIPEKYTCDGEDLSPPLKIENVPETAKSLVLIIDDPDAPKGTWNHLLVWNIDPKTHKIIENSTFGNSFFGTNDFGKLSYGGPCPPSETPHRYYFRVFALDTILNLPQGSNRQELQEAIKGHIIRQGNLMGKYSKKA